MCIWRGLPRSNVSFVCLFDSEAACHSLCHRAVDTNTSLYQYVLFQKIIVL